MNQLSQRSRAMTLIEALVVMSLSTVVFGLILNTLMVTQRESDRITAVEQMHQEALLISQSVERTLRFRVAPEELEGAFSGGAGPNEPTAGGGATTSTLPASIAAISSSTLLMTTSSRSVAPVTPDSMETSTRAIEEASPERLPTASRTDFTSAPASIQGILGTTTSVVVPPVPAATVANSGSPASQASVAAATSVSISASSAPSAPAPVEPAAAEPKQPAPAQVGANPATVQAGAAKRPASGEERFSAAEVVVYSLGSGSDPGKVVSAIRNSRGLGPVPSHAFLEQSSLGSTFAPGARRRSLGPNSDRFQSQVSFRFASSFQGTRAKWMRETREVPRLVEYTVRVWPVGSGDSFEEAERAEKRTPVFQLTSAVAL
ncbi:MAG: hypothetical protein ACR2IE_04080 [Candidatus Sumerlaeaceae bacterium]